MHCQIIPEKCIACGLCQVYAPEIFEYDNEGIVLLKQEINKLEQKIMPEQIENVLIAYRKCPVRAIELVKD